MKMKKIWLVLFVLSLLLTAAACGDDKAVESKTEKEAYKSSKQTRNRIGPMYLFCRSTMSCGSRTTEYVRRGN